MLSCCKQSVLQRQYTVVAYAWTADMRLPYFFYREADVDSAEEHVHFTTSPACA